MAPGITSEWDGINDDSNMVKKLLEVGLPTDLGICLSTKSLHEMPIKLPAIWF